MGIKELLTDGIDKTLSSVKNVITTFVQDKGLQQQINAEIEKQAHELKLKQLELMGNTIQAEVNDRADARAMYRESIKSDDRFIRRFPMVLAASIMGVSALILLALIFFEIPNTNRDILNISLGTLIGGSVTAIVNFYFGSSYVEKKQ